MLVDRSGRVWAMRGDTHGITEAVDLRKQVQSAREAHGEDGVAAILRGDRLEGSDFARVVDGVAVVPVRGALMRSFSFWFWSYEEIQRDVALALADASVSAVLLEIDSPGGLVAGCDDLAAWLRGMAQGGTKPIEAFVGGAAASAAYYVASAASRIGMGSGSMAGSIGTVIEYVDVEPMFEAAGARIVRVVAEQSPNKRLDPESETGRAELQALVDAGGAEFVAAVAAGRGVSEAEVMERFGQGLVFDAGEAIARGMADTRTTLEEMIAELAGRDPTFGAAPAAAGTEETPMDWATLTAAALREHRADLVEELTADAAASAETEIAAARAAGAEAERERLLALDEVAMPGHENLLAEAKADGKTTAADLALQMVKADKAAGGKALSARAADDDLVAVPAAQPAQGAATLPDDAPIEDRAKAEWDKNANVRSEFGNDFDSYLAFRKAEDRGAARVLRRVS